jgi:RNA recognition motif. (a.k.a. RRM, RBD, or RNP domain)
MIKKVYLGGLNPTTTAAELEERFGKFGRIERLCIPFPKNPQTGYAFVDLDTTEEAYKKCSIALTAGCSIYNGRVWKGSTLIIREATQDYSTALKREQQEVIRESEHVKKPSNKKLKKMPVTMAPPGPITPKRKGWIRLEGRMLPVMKLRSDKTGRVLKIDPSKYDAITKLTLEPIESDKPITYELERTQEQVDAQRKRAGIWTNEEIQQCKKLARVALASQMKLAKAAQRAGKSVKQLVEDKQREIALLTERGNTLAIVNDLFTPEIKIHEGVVEFSDDGEDFEIEEDKNGGIFEDSESDGLFEQEAMPIVLPIKEKKYHPNAKTKEDMLAMFSDDDE